MSIYETYTYSVREKYSLQHSDYIPICPSDCGYVRNKYAFDKQWSFCAVSEDMYSDPQWSHGVD